MPCTRRPLLMQDKVESDCESKINMKSSSEVVSMALNNASSACSVGKNANSDTVLAKRLPHGKCVYGRYANSG